MEVRFPENKEEKKIRTKLLNAAKWKGKKIAPSGCLPISTEDILNQSSLTMNSTNNISILNANDSYNMFSENENTVVYDNKDMNHYDNTNINHLNWSEQFSELCKTTSETTSDTLNNDYFNKMEEVKMGTYNRTYRKVPHENYTDNMNINLMLQGNLGEFLPKFFNRQ